MFKIPDWEDSVPAANLGFLKEINKKKHKQKNKHQLDKTSHTNNDEEIGKLIHNPNKPSQQKQQKESKRRNSSNKRLNGRNNIPVPKTDGSLLKNMDNSTSGPKSKGFILNNTDNNLQKNIPASRKNGLLLKNIDCDTKEIPNLKSQATNQVTSVKNMNSNTINASSPKSKKRKHEKDKKILQKSNENQELQNLDINKLDEAIVSAKKRKLNKSINKEEKDVEGTILEERRVCKEYKKKLVLKNMLQKQNQRNVYQVNGNGLRERMLQRLKAAQFRYLNEKLYTSSGSDAKKLFDEDPNAFQTYHEGYQQQVKKWPVKPLDVIVNRILKMPKSHLIVDMGCGEGVLSRRVPQTVRSFDLVAFNPNVEVCDIAHTPLLAGSMNVAVYCLALMGTDLTQYIVEANRVLKKGGHLLIAEVESRFDDVDKFVKEVEKIGFSVKKLDKSNNVFYFMEFTKVNEPPKKSKLPYLSLKPCFYKKR